MTNTTSIEISLTETERAALAAMAPDRNPTEAIAGLAMGLLQDLAGGGTMLTPVAVSRLRTSVEDPFDEDQIIGMAEKGARRFGDSVVVEYTIDPIYITPLEDVAKSNGMSLRDLVQSCIGSAFEMGWFYEMNLDSRNIVLTVEQYNAIRSKLGREQIFGKDVAESIASADLDPKANIFAQIVQGQIAAPEPGESVNVPANTTRANAEDGEQPAAEGEEASLFAGVV